jgi:murein DD-endopeptidase MepM/ murein hydrolase activator NlpD
MSWEVRPDSIYTLYGHLLSPVDYEIGDTVQAGDLIGQVGTTGASVNPHLHLEMRWGPGGTKFASMGFYDTSITDSERENYCQWRVSGQFILLNPMDVVNTWLNQSSPGS